VYAFQEGSEIMMDTCALSIEVRRGREACEERARESKKCCEVDLYTAFIPFY
jgi:hypothetical protein